MAITRRGRVIAHLVPARPSSATPADLSALWADLDALAAEIGARTPRKTGSPSSASPPRTCAETLPPPALCPIPLQSAFSAQTHRISARTEADLTLRGMGGKIAIQSQGSKAQGAEEQGSGGAGGQRGKGAEGRGSGGRGSGGAGERRSGEQIAGPPSGRV